jgi:DNA-binding transcriptional MerR regulator
LSRPCSEREGLLSAGKQTSGYRVDGDAALQVVSRIRALNTAGLTLEVIRRVLPCARAGSLHFEPCLEFQSSARRQIAELDRRISELHESRRTLAGYLVAAQ